jgi:hypothetical protein
MANPTSNFGWQMPTPTDLVTDLPADFEVFGQAVDTSLADLLGGTTGQVLAKNSNTNMDFVWVTSDDANAIQNAIVDAKGDLIAASANDTPARLAVGNNGETLVADSSTSTGLRYQGNFAAGKNKLINGNMVIDQRNAGAAVTVNQTPGVFCVDRWFGSGVPTDGVFTLQQDSSAPSGFTKSIKATITTIDTSIPLTGGYNVTQILEGFTTADLGYGAAGAKTTTLSFWVRSSVTGTFGGSLRNSATNRSYAFTYSISVADTWEKKSITIEGDTSGTWVTDSGIGLRLTFALGSGADRLGTAGAWAGASYNGATGQTQLIETLNATWFVTGVQFEIGSVATAFQTATGTIQGELAACMRYAEKVEYTGSTVLTVGQAYSTSAAWGGISWTTQKRATPTITQTGTIQALQAGTGTSGTTFAYNTIGTNNVRIDHSGGSGLVAGNACIFQASGAVSLLITAEL